MIGLPLSSHGNHTHADDQLALLAFKAQISHDPLHLLDSWNTTLHFCEWHRVTCGRRHQRVVKLDLPARGLVGSVSPHIGNLSFLRTIDLQNNSFHGEIPSEVSRLYRLRVLGMSNNSFTGEIPRNLSRCPHLIFISMNCNKLSGEIPKELGSLQKLEELVLWNNNLTGTIPYALGNLSSIKFIDLAGNNLHGRIPDSLGQLKNLQVLQLGRNMLSSTVPLSIYNLSSLQTLAFPINQISGRLPSDIGLTLPNLRNFLISSNHFFGSIPSSLFNISTLSMLELAVNGFIGQVPANMGCMSNLQWLHLANNRLGSFGQADDDLKFLSSIVNCSTNLQVLDVAKNQLSGILHISLVNISSTQLIFLSLQENQISGTIPSEIIKLTNLAVLSFHQNFLTGSIPQDIGKLSNLQELHLGHNKLSGNIPMSINNLTRLLHLGLSNNNFEGHIIPNTNNLQSLQQLGLSGNKLNGTLKQVFGQPSHELLYVYLDNNSFTGSIPFEVGNFENLVDMDISNNDLAGEIPNALGKCLSLQHLSLTGNSFHGSIPPSFSSLQGLQLLDLSLNNLSGEIPMFFQNLSSSIQYLNLSFNNFEGAVPTEGLFQNASAFSVLGNTKVCGGIPKLQLPTCPDKQKHNKRHHMPLHSKVAIGVIVSTTVLATILFVLICWLRRPKNVVQAQKDLHDHYERVSFLDLHRATNGFSSTNAIGAGHFGSVFKAIIREGMEPVAVKVLNMIDHKASNKTFMAECEALRNVRHRNLMKIVTACSTVDFQGNDFKALIFKFMPNGSLESWLHPIAFSDGSYLKENLNLSQRIDIAIDIASALDYLHNQCEMPIIHCDLKPSNILLDEDMVAHVSDFGLATFLQRKNSYSGSKSSFSPRGTIGYIPPEYGIGVKPSTQGDVYSYGVLLLEMFTGKRPTDEVFDDGLDLHKFSKFALHKHVMKIIDSHMLEREGNDRHQDIHGINIESRRGTRHVSGRVEECISSIIKVGVGCSMPSPSERINIKDALKELLAAKELYFPDRA